MSLLSASFSHQDFRSLPLVSNHNILAYITRKLSPQHRIDFTIVHHYTFNTWFTLYVKERHVDNLFMIFGWGSPIGIGIFLLCIGGMVFILSKAGKKDKKD